jgi:hypothetical protein
VLAEVQPARVSAATAATAVTATRVRSRDMRVGLSSGMTKTLKSESGPLRSAA